MKFTKMQAYGNDYIYVNNINENLENINELARNLSNRHYGIGSDGLVLICDSDVADFKMRIFNPDGTEAEMCGNAIRSVGKYVYEHKLTKKEKLTIETLGGIKELELIIKDKQVVNIKANLFKPIFDSILIPVKTEKKEFMMEDVEVLDTHFKLSSLSWGNPHTVVFVSDVDHFEVEKYGPLIEHLDIFPERTNVTFAEIIDHQTIKIREWERGTGETLGCATGASSAVVIASKIGVASNCCKVIQPGGTIEIEYNKNQELVMKGPSTTVFEGEIDLPKGEEK